MPFLIFKSLDSPSIGRRLCFSRLLFETCSWANITLLISTRRFRNPQPFFLFFRRLTAFPLGSRCFDIHKSALVCFFISFKHFSAAIQNLALIRILTRVYNFLCFELDFYSDWLLDLVGRIIGVTLLSAP